MASFSWRDRAFYFAPAKATGPYKSPGVGDFLRCGGQARTVSQVDVRSVVGSQLTYCVEVVAELLADIESKQSVLSTRLSGQGEKVPGVVCLS